MGGRSGENGGLIGDLIATSHERLHNESGPEDQSSCLSNLMSFDPCCCSSDRTPPSDAEAITWKRRYGLRN